MTKLNENVENYLSNFKEKNFTEEDFVGLLLPLLRRNGIYRIDEEELRKKLYYYYKKSEFRELFQDICPFRGTLDKEVDINNGMYHEKYFGGCITWSSMRPNILYLHYDIDMDLSWRENKLSENGISLIQKMAEELGMIDRVESNSKHKMYIYSCDPNKSYTLVKGKYRGKVLSWQLLTDGAIKAINYLNSEELAHCFFDSPDSPNCKVQLDQNTIASVDLENASYAVMQGLSDRKIQYVKVFTNLVSLEQLNKISDIANVEYNTDDNYLIDKESYVRKIVLK